MAFLSTSEISFEFPYSLKVFQHVLPIVSKLPRNL